MPLAHGHHRGARGKKETGLDAGSMSKYEDGHRVTVTERDNAQDGLVRESRI